VADKPRHYLQEFKDDAVALVTPSDRPVAEVARSLGVSDRTLWNWVNNTRQCHARANDPIALSEEEL
jgi:transposase-like protein